MGCLYYRWSEKGCALIIGTSAESIGSIIVLNKEWMWFLELPVTFIHDPSL